MSSRYPAWIVLLLLGVIAATHTSSAQPTMQTIVSTANASFPLGSGVSAVSADGSTFVYSIGSTDTYIWNSSTGSTALGRFDVSSSQESLSGLSADGSTVIGYARTGTSGHRLFTPFAWTAGGGYTTLATPITENTFNHPSAVSGDGSLIALTANSLNYTWNATDGLNAADALVKSYSSSTSIYVEGTNLHRNGTVVPLGTTGLNPTDNWSSIGPAVIAANGTHVVGSVFNSEDFFTGDYHSQAFRWTEAGGFELLGYLSGHRESDALSVSADGNIIVGDYGPNNLTDFEYYAFIWDPVSGMRDLGTALTDLGLDVSGWSFSAAQISADGTTIVGSGQYNGMDSIFRVTGYEIAAVPEPSTYALWAGFLAIAVPVVRRKRRQSR